MNYTFENEDFVYAFDFKVNGNFVVPDDNAYVYKVRNIDGTILTSGEGTTVPEVDDEEEKIESDEELHPDSSSFVIPAEYNTREEGKLFEGRIIEISFFYKGKPYTIRDSYRVTGFYYFTASTKDVRDYYGLNEGELPDADIDLTEVYLQLVQKHGQTFIDCLNTAGLGNIRANRLIVLKGVVQVFSSVRLRVNQEENDGSSKFIRYLNKIDWDALLDSALSEIEELEGNLTGEEVITYTGYNPFFLGAVRDAITGEEE